MGKHIKDKELSEACSTHRRYA